MKRSIPIFLVVMLLAACAPAPTGLGVATPIVITAEVSTVIAENGGTPQPLPTAAPPTPIPTLSGGLSVTELRYKVLEEFPDFFFCDPDYYPIAREEESILAQKAFPELQADQEEFQAILDHTGLSGQTTFSAEQVLQIYREHKKLNAIHFQLVDDRYRFQIQTGTEGQSGAVVTGTIDASGSIDVLQREEAFPACPICLAAGTLIDTPHGGLRVENLREGDLVWTLDATGRRVAAPIVRTGQMRVPATHRMIHLTLGDGRELWASPGHPTADGRRLGHLRAGDILDGAAIVQLERVTYGQTYTFDILPSGVTGVYWTNGILMGSTLSSP